MIAGPCSAETERQVLSVAAVLREQGVAVMRAGLWKPRTRPGHFEGVGRAGLAWLCRAREEYGLRICTEVACREQVESCMQAGVDLLWTGARTTSSPFLMQEIADALRGADIPVLVKNPLNRDIELWIGAIERLSRAGLRRIGVIHRGFSSVESLDYRNVPGWQTAVELRTRYPRLPFFADPSHIAGDRKLVGEVARRALALGVDGLMIEVHCRPGEALSDAAQQLSPEEFGALLKELRLFRKDSDDREYRDELMQLREQIDLIDGTLIQALAARMEISRRIGECKKARRVAVLQTARWEEVLEKAVRKCRDCGLRDDFVKAVFQLLHAESVRIQDEMRPTRKE